MSVYNYSKWIEMAEIDMETARILLKEGRYYQPVCFHVHQAVEKLLKAYIVFKGLKPKKSHDLEELCTICSNYEQGFLKYMDDCTELSTYYIETRYPLDIPFSEISKDEARKALVMGEDICRFVKSILNI